MKAVLLLAHGSRENDSEITMQTITKMVKNKLNIELIEEAYLQLRDITLDKGLDSLIEKGATEIIVIPYFLFEGVHIREDIPAELETYKEKKNTSVKITFGKTLGADSRLADIVCDRISEIM